MAGPTLPYTFANGTTADATQVNANFQAIVTYLASLGAGSLPLGRLSLSSTLPVMNANAVNQSVVYYLPFVGNTVPTYSGSAFSTNTFTSYSCTLTAGANVSGGIYDLALAYNGGTPVLVTLPAWTNSTTRSTAITQSVGGLWTNTGSTTGMNNGVSYAIGANQGTYLGTIYCNGAAEVTWSPFGVPTATGGNALLGLFNGYNRMLSLGRSIDSNAQWAATAILTWQTLDGSNNNRVTWIDGLGYSAVKASAGCTILTANGTAAVGVIEDSTSATPTMPAINVGPSDVAVYVQTIEEFPPALGLHYAQGMQFANTESNVNFSYVGSTGGNGTQVSAELSL